MPFGKLSVDQPCGVSTPLSRCTMNTSFNAHPGAVDGAVHAVGEQHLVGGVGAAHERRFGRPVHQALLAEQPRPEGQAGVVIADQRPCPGSVVNVPVALVGHLVCGRAGSDCQGAVANCRDRCESSCGASERSEPGCVVGGWNLYGRPVSGHVRVLSVPAW